MRALGKNQLGMMRGMQHRHGNWYTGCGWLWGTDSGTHRICRSLIKHGLVTVSIAKGIGVMYTLTDVGHAFEV